MDILNDDANAIPLANLRDLGGLRVGGGTTRPGVLWRSDDVSLAPRWEIDLLREQGVTTVLDLRSPTERDRSDHDDVAGANLDLHHLPLFDMPTDPESMLMHWSEVTTARELGLRYAQMVRDAAPTIVNGLTLVAEASGATLFHCAAGKDRTGVFAASVLACLGADREVLVADYARTDEVMPAVLARITVGFGGDAADFAPLIDPDSPLLRAPAESMATMLDELDHERGGVVELLRDNGLDDALLQLLNERLIVAP